MHIAPMTTTERNVADDMINEGHSIEAITGHVLSYRIISGTISTGSLEMYTEAFNAIYGEIARMVTGSDNPAQQPQ